MLRRCFFSSVASIWIVELRMFWLLRTNGMQWSQKMESAGSIVQMKCSALQNALFYEVSLAGWSLEVNYRLTKAINNVCPTHFIWDLRRGTIDIRLNESIHLDEHKFAPSNITIIKKCPSAYAQSRFNCHSVYSLIHCILHHTGLHVCAVFQLPYINQSNGI